MNKVIVGVVAAVIIIAAVILYATNEPQPVAQTPEEQPVQQIPQETPAVTSRTIRLPVTLTGQFFNPSSIEANMGDTVILTITSADMGHIIYVPSHNITEEAPELQPVTITLPITGTNDLDVLCSDQCDIGVKFTVDVQ